MAYARTDDGVRLYYEETGSGLPVIFVHEFAGDFRSWEAQVRHFSRRYRCITFNARGYPPSDVPADPASYNQARARDDIKAVLQHAGAERAHVVGLSMGGFATLHFGLAWPELARSLVVAGCGYGAEPERRALFQAEAEATAERFRRDGAEKFSAVYASGPTRVRFRDKDPRGWRAFAEQLAGHSAEGSACTMLGIQRNRPSLWDLEEAMRALAVPTLVVTGDEDDPCLLPAIFMKRTIAASALVVMPNTGHTLNLEEPDLFNRTLGDFFAQVEAGRWAPRDPPSPSGSILGTRPEA